MHLYILAMGSWAFSECSLCVGIAQTGDALTVPVRLMQGVHTCISHTHGVTFATTRAKIFSLG